MPFFIPERYLKLNIFGGGDTSANEDDVLSEMPESSKRELNNKRSFAFFAVEFGYSKKDYNELTPTERALILKEWENKKMRDTELIRNAVLNAISNSMRKKGARFVELWPKEQAPKNGAKMSEMLETAEEANRNDGDWYSKILKDNGFI